MTFEHKHFFEFFYHFLAFDDPLGVTAIAVSQARANDVGDHKCCCKYTNEEHYHVEEADAQKVSG